MNVPDQKEADYIAAIMAAIPTSAFSESFDGATFPPTTNPGWATPSPRFGADLSWVRSTTNPIAGTASASAPVPQGTTTNSSLGLTLTFASPARISFLFAVNCNANTSDHLDFIIDGVTVAQFSSQVSNTLVGGRFVSDLLREGPHTFDWRFIRGGSASVGAEECKIDTVEIIPDEVWRGDSARVFIFDDQFIPMSPATLFLHGIGAGVSGEEAVPPWCINTGSNQGSYYGRQVVTAAGHGVLGLSTAATAAGDYCNAFTQGDASAGIVTYAKQPFCEFRIAIPALTVNYIVEVGIADINPPASVNGVVWAWDGSLGIGSNWQFRRLNAGAATNSDSGVAIAAATYFRFGVSVATVRGVNGAVFTKDGKALPGAGSIPPGLFASLPAGPFAPGKFVARTVTAAAVCKAELDWTRQMFLRL